MTSAKISRPFPGTRLGSFPALDRLQQAALATLLVPSTGSAGAATAINGPRVDGCQVTAIVCDSEGNVIEVNHELAAMARGETGNPTNRRRAGLKLLHRGPHNAFRLDGRSLALLPRLRALELNACGVTGTLPPQLGGLLDLTAVDLFDNQLTGTLPRSFSALGNLRSLVLASNRLGGSLSSALFAGSTGNSSSRAGGAAVGMTALELLDLSFNDFRGSFPTAAAQDSLASLRVLRLNDNRASSTNQQAAACLPA